MDILFEESRLGDGFCKQTVKQAEDFITSSQNFVVVGLPAMGISIFLKYLSCQPIAHFIHINTYEMDELTKDDFFRLIYRRLGGKKDLHSTTDILEAIRQKLKEEVQKFGKTVLVFNRFDRLSEEFDDLLFANLRSLRDVDRDNIILVLSACKPLTQIAPEAVAGNIKLYDNNLFLKPYSTSDLKKILLLKDPTSFNLHKNMEKVLKLCGGHYALLHVILRCERLENPLLDHFVKLQLKALYDFLDYKKRKTVEKIALDKEVNQVDQYLLDVGMVVKRGEKYELFTPLFSEYIRSHAQIKLPAKEKRLFQLLSKNLDQVISKELIYQAVWRDEDEGSEWALNALIYRLRKNPYFIAQGYIIENHKKEGYVMYKD